MVKLSMDQALIKAKSHWEKGEIEEAQKLYQAVLQAFPQNKRAQKGLAALNKPKQFTVTQGTSQEVIKKLLSLYNQGQLAAAVEQATGLKEQYPEALIVWNILGAANKGLNRLSEASDAFKKVTELNPTYADGFNNLGATLQEQGKLDEAIEAYNKALSLKSDYADAAYNMGNALQKQGKLDEAIEAYNKALSLKSDYVGAYNNMGNALQKQGKLDEAIEAYDKELSLKPDDAEVYNNRGVALQDQGKLGEAIEAYNKALSLKPDYVGAYNNMGNALQEKGKLDEAIEAYDKALSLKSDYAEAYYNRGVALQDQGKRDEAIEAYKKALSLKSDYVGAYNNMGNALQEKGKLDEAIEAYDKELSLKPDDAEVYNNRGVALQIQGKLDEAIEAYNRAVSLKPDYAEAHLNLSFALLNFGDLRKGLVEYEWRWKTSDFSSKRRHFSQPLWDGVENLKGRRILLWGEQGPQDMIVWSFCLPYLSSHAGHCIIECQEKLVPLLARSFPNFEVKAENRSLDNYRNDFDFHLPMGSLFRHFIPEISKKTKPDAFLIPDPARVSFWKERLNSLGNGPFVGVSWKSPVMNPKRLPNYTKISDWAPVLRLSNVTFINLQSSDFRDDLAAIHDEFGIKVHHFDDLNHYDNLNDVAALSAALDIAVSVSTAVSAIAAGVGTPTKLVAWHQSSWNNLLLAPRGPSVDTFERNTWEPWDEVFNAIAKDIGKHQGA